MLSKLEAHHRRAHLEREHGAYVLWLIKHRYCESWADLEAHFREAKCPGSELMDGLFGVVYRLFEAGALEARNEQGVVGHSDWMIEKRTLHITEQWSRLQRALGISLTQVASIVPGSSQVTTPVFGPAAKDNASDVFVVMSFADSLQPIYEDHIKPTALKVGLTCRRGDDFFTNGAIIQDIWNAINNAKCVIGDCTGRNPNVFYELGMAHTVGVPTIIVTQDKGDAPFDVNHVRRIQYECTPPGISHFEQALESTLREVLGKPADDGSVVP
jgi:hypothetical protein